MKKQTGLVWGFSHKQRVDLLLRESAGSGKENYQKEEKGRGKTGGARGKGKKNITT